MSSTSPGPEVALLIADPRPDRAGEHFEVLVLSRVVVLGGRLSSLAVGRLDLEHLRGALPDGQGFGGRELEGAGHVPSRLTRADGDRRDRRDVDAHVARELLAGERDL